MRTYGRLFYLQKNHAFKAAFAKRGLIVDAPISNSKDARWVMTEVEPHVAIRLKNNFQGIPIYQAGLFTFPDTPEMALDLDWFISRYPMRMEPQDRQRLTEKKTIHIDQLAEFERIVAPDYKGRVFKLNGDFRRYQSQFAELALKTKRILNADDVGLGKTRQAIMVLTEQTTLPALVVVQSHLPKQWEGQIQKFLPFARVHLVKGTRPYNLPKADIYVMKYSCVAGWTDFYGTGFFKTVIFDEVQELRRDESNKYGGAKSLSHAPQIALGLSATPIYNYGGEIYNVMDVLKPGCLGTKEEFMREWCRGEKGIVMDPDALGSFLRENYLMVRRTRKEVKMELPPINTIVHTVDMDSKAIESVEEIARALAMKTLEGSFTERGQASRELDLLLRQATGIGKAKFVADYVRILLENGESVLLAGWHRAVYEIWQEELKEFEPVLYTGSESSRAKEESKQRFIEGKSKLMIISLRSGIGLDGLQQKASIVVFGELDWSPGVHYQVIGRLNRDGQKDQVTAIYLVANEGSDPVIVDMLGIKSSQEKGIMNPGAVVDKQYSDESRVKKLAQDFLKRKREKKAEVK